MTPTIAIWIASIALVSATRNLTVTFSRAELDTCGSANQGQGLAFSTSDIPDRFTCFNIDDIFGQNSTSGARNQTGSPLSWVVRNGEIYDPAANYSRILYDQVNSTIDTGAIASRAINVYNGRQCLQTGGEIGVEPWFGWSCQSRDQGTCYNLPYPIKSFAINARTNVNTGDQCWDFAYNGEATRPQSKAFISLISAIATLLLIQ